MKMGSILLNTLIILGAGLALITSSVTAPLAHEISQREPQTIEAFAENHSCFECHNVNKKVLGPAYRDVAARYKDDPRARPFLVDKIKKGGKGNWTKLTGGVPMPSYASRLSDPEIKRLVDWILSLHDSEVQ